MKNRRMYRSGWIALILAIALMLSAGLPAANASAAQEAEGTSESEEAASQTAGQEGAQEDAYTPVNRQLKVKVTKSTKKYKKKVTATDTIELSVYSGSAPANLSRCKFSSSKKKVASVSKKGVITAKKKGKAVITVRYKTAKGKTRKAKITVTVKALPVSASLSAATHTPYNGAPGKRTLKGFLQNGLVPCGRTLYIYGGGWGNEKIGYQESWREFFEQHAGPNYKNSKYQFKRDKGFDCSGFVGWTTYNTLYSESGKSSLASSASGVAAKYAKKGWAKLAKNSKDKTFKPGDVVSKSGHVWISLGQCADGSVLILHSTPESGVQISGTRGKAADLAAYYMAKYFPNWPYKAKHMGSSYWKYKGKARWKVRGSGAILSDPDGIQNMTGEQALQCLLGK